jgi:hypothetical protein
VLEVPPVAEVLLDEAALDAPPALDPPVGLVPPTLDEEKLLLVLEDAPPLELVILPAPPPTGLDEPPEVELLQATNEPMARMKRI